MPRAFLILAAVAASLLVAPSAAGAPADALQGEQWAVAPDTLFDLPGAWELSDGAGVVVAVVDSGMRLDHPDLAPNAWTNFAEVPGNGVDDDANGYVDDVHGVDLTSGRSGQDVHDGYGHGTHVSGTIAAAANGRGVVGVAYRAKLMTVKVLDDAGAGTTGGVAEGIRYAAANGARIVNLSLETQFDDPRMRAAVAAAAAANVLVICAAGNSGLNVDRSAVFPVSITAPNLVGVAATAPDEGTRAAAVLQLRPADGPGRRAGRRGPLHIHEGGFEVKSGTSMAAPHVTGVAALMAAVAPGLFAADLRALLLQHAARSSAPVAAGHGRRARLGPGRQHRVEPDARAAGPASPAERDPQGPPHPGPDRADRRDPGRRPRRRDARRPPGRDVARRSQRDDRPSAPGAPAASW